MITISTVIDYLEQFAPLALAADWDNVGLLLGDRTAEVHRIMTCLTVTPGTAAEAVQSGAGLIISHHPILFRAVQRLTSDTWEGRMLLSLVRAGVAVYSPHTAFDNTRGGINELIAERLSLAAVTSLRSGSGAARCKIVVFVPEADLQRVADAMFAAGAGHIGQYRECSFRATGTGTFFGSDTTNPTVGQKGRREEVAEWRLETICLEPSIGPIIAAMRGAHSYEEPAYDVYPLRPESGALGEGRIGKLPKSTLLGELAKRVKEILKAEIVQVAGDQTKPVQRVAIVCGAGGGFIGDAVRSGADVLLTGETRFHDCVAAQAHGLALILAGHYATERFGVEKLAQRLQQKWSDLQVWASRTERDPLKG